ncbi:serine/threonine protein kinase [Myxococcus xanthus DK 1622]|uniref:Serine/threonine protein kinase n=2 Tax=Myxococcus xanthus TaxID=34 RepID=Q1D576_MYXXD|nr:MULTISPECIES: serine/threonine-protein kinase [Myxococcus]AAD47061.1 pkn4 [Myxococcus xanthus DZF1]ABF85881.1 serine/threonine protein kinase [Myxococcus xanthus DK 1622]NOJ51557.1 protein kinase [Myxococcus xanthus]QPM76639.1 protein kinase [Myxococcus xanthus]QVW65702.1 protein kinase [Myxococcus xanthus DZ2]
MTTLVGRHIGRYRILEQLGSGGMSVVYKGLDTALDREVAVKVLHPHLAGKDESRRRLAREARAVAKLHHPNILEVFDFSAADAQDAFIVTEYIRGQTLKAFMDEGPMDPPELAAMVIHELAAALAHAHESGVIHRDLKPENVMVREDGVLKLMDFGIARLMDIEERMTVTGTLVGSPAHMAPEIIEGLEAGPTADVFSVGIMFYAAMTGRLPFSAPNTTATLKRILDGDYEDARRRVPALSDELADICAICLQRDPERRYPDAARLRDALADYLAGLGFARVGEELVSYFADPPSYRKLARQRIVATLLERSERQLAEKRTPRALASLNQVLALDTTNARALALLKGIQRAQRIKTWRRRGLRLGVGVAAAGLLGLGGWKARHANDAEATTPPDATTPGQVAATLPPTPPSEPLATVAPPDTTPAPKESAGRPGPGTSQPPRPASRGVKGATAPGGLSPRTDGTPAVGGTVRGMGTRPAGEDEEAPRKPLVRKLPVSILVRPYGSIRVDDGVPSAQPLQKHDVEVTPGRHTVTISCDYCEDVVDTIDVQPDGDNVFHLRAQPKASRLSVDFEPAGALVRVGDEFRSAEDSLKTPFEVRSPRGPAGFQHTVVVEVSHPGYVPERRVVHLRPGEPTTLRGSLRPE